MSSAIFYGLSRRLEQAFAMAEPVALGADIGADHGQLSAALLTRGKAQHMLVADISAPSLDKARRTLMGMDLDERATFAVADGFRALDALHGRTPECIFILGMGGETLRHILLDGSARLNGASLILGAQTDLPLARQTLCDIAYRIREEIPVEENNQSYILMRCSPMLNGEPLYDRRELLLGPLLLKTLPPEWRLMLERRAALLLRAQAAMAQASGDKGRTRLTAVREELTLVQDALALYEDH